MKKFPLPQIVFLFLLALKLLDINGHGDMSWWWVFSPMWIAIGLLGINELLNGKKTKETS